MKKQILPKHLFFNRLRRTVLFSIIIIFFSLLIGTVGYHLSANLPWIDSFLNASMILTGMGPVNVMSSFSSKLFSALYALFSGVVFLTTIAVTIAPLVHRWLNIFHLPDEKGEN